MMRLALFALLATASQAWTMQDMRQAFVGTAAGLAISVATPAFADIVSTVTSNAVITDSVVNAGKSVAGATPTRFSGSFSDPFHPNCKRQLVVNGNEVTLTGTDGNPGCPADGSGKEWTLKAVIDANESSKMSVDFSPKGGPKGILGTWEDGDAPGIRWGDGNKWSLKN
jgi:hypothetical protein